MIEIMRRASPRSSTSEGENDLPDETEQECCD